MLTKVEEMRDGPSGASTCSQLKVIEVGYDENGNLITSCVIVEDDNQDATQPKLPGQSTKDPSPVARKFYDALTDALTVYSEKRPQSAGRLSVTEDEWRKELIRLGLVDEARPKPMSASISKYRQQLIAANWIGYNDKIVWSIK